MRIFGRATPMTAWNQTLHHSPITTASTPFNSLD